MFPGVWVKRDKNIKAVTQVELDMSHERSTSATGFLSREREYFWSRDGSSEKVALDIDRILRVDTEGAGK